MLRSSSLSSSDILSSHQAGLWRLEHKIVNNFIIVVKNPRTNMPVSHIANVSLYLHPSVVYASSEGSGKSAHIGRVARTVAEVRKYCALAHDDLSTINILIKFMIIFRERSGSVVEFLTQVRGCRVEPNRWHCIVSMSKTH